MANLLWKKLTLLYVICTQGLNYLLGKLTYRGRIKQKDERSIEGNVVIVTGANSGIGKETSYEFAIRKATVIMACRNLEEGNKAIEEHRKRALDAGISFTLDLVLIHLDLSDFSSVRTFCKEVKIKFEKIHILVNNAGIFDTSGKIKRTKDGIEEHLAINYLSHFLLTNLLLDTMQGGKVEDACRILEVSSTAQMSALLRDENNLMLEDPPKTMGFVNTFPYALSKFYGSLFAKELNHRLNQTQTIAYSLCPGLVNTGLFRSFDWYRGMLTKFTLFFFSVSLAKGCDTILYLALSKDPPLGGLFYRLSKPQPYLNKRVEENEKLGKEIWNLSEQAVGLKT